MPVGSGAVFILADGFNMDKLLPRLEKLDLRWNRIDHVPDEFNGFLEKGGLLYL